MHCKVEIDAQIKDEICFLKERVDLMQNIIEIQRTLIGAQDQYISQLQEEINDILGNP